MGLSARQGKRGLRERRRAPAQRPGPGHAHLGCELARRRGSGAARERDPAPARRGDPPRDPRDRPRGDLLRADGARGRRLPAGDRSREHLGAGSRRGARRRDPRPDARGRRPPGSFARARRLSRSALGADRGDVRRGPLPRLARRRGVHARASGAVAPERGGRHAEALRRLRRVGRRDELGAGRNPAPRRCARCTCIRSRRRFASPALAR